MDTKWLILGALFGGLAVLAGALGSHTLSGVLDAKAMGRYELAVRYQMYHAILLIIVYLIRQQVQLQTLEIAGWAIFAGILLFCGSLYLLAFTEISTFGVITPFGGIAFVIGWILLIFVGIKSV